ncbi:hypothetical protein J6590_077601 [Homalodisca vitripennis]|nr:hypothetical protein J6590_077601 [Homalodisca vitripennis]
MESMMVSRLMDGTAVGVEETPSPLSVDVGTRWRHYLLATSDNTRRDVGVAELVLASLLENI